MNEIGNADPRDRTRHDFWKAAYVTMLAELPPEAILEWFAARPMEMEGRTWRGAELLELLWSPKGMISMDWNYAGVDQIERFLIGHDCDPFAFMRKLLFRNNRATYMPGKVVLSWFYPIMESVFRTYDPREMVFNLIAVFTETYLPKHLHRRLKKDVSGEWISSYLFYTSDKDFRTVRNFNFDLIAGEQIRAAPRIIDLPEFEEVGYLSDCRTLEEMIWQGTTERTDGQFYLDGLPIAKRTGFHAFAKERNLPISKFSAPDFEVYVADREVACPIRNRVVIYEGCAYGAPGYISVVKHRKTVKAERKYLKHMIMDADLEEDLLGPEMARRHAALVQRARESAMFTWIESDESMELNGKHFIKGIPAKILKYIMEAYLGSGKHEFEYRDLKRQFEITLGQKHANFEVRFARLAEKLVQEASGIRLERTGRGRFRLVVSGKLEMRSIVV